MFPFFPLSDIINFGAKIGTTIGNNLATGQAPTRNLATILAAPASPIIIQNPPPVQGSFFGGDFKIGFVEKNVIIIGVFALGAVAIWKVIK